MLEAVNDKTGEVEKALAAARRWTWAAARRCSPQIWTGRSQNSGGRTSRIATACGPRSRWTASRWTCRRRCSASANGHATGSTCG